MKKIVPLGLAALIAASPFSRATETENLEFRILPAPGPVKVDGQFDDWDLSGSIFICSDVENYRDEFASWQSAMYDAENLYLLTRWNDSTPLNNPGLAGSDMGFLGDCLQARLIMSSSGQVDAGGDDKALGQKTTHITAWAGRDGRDVIDLAYGKKFDEGNVTDAKKEGARQAFHKLPDGKGYVQEIAIPWKLLTADGKAPKAGDSAVLTYEPNFGTASKFRISTKDLFRKGVTPDRVFAFSANGKWGTPAFTAKGSVEPSAVRLADGRTFPVSMEGDLPVVNWTGLFQEDKLAGFVKISVEMPEDGFVSLVIKNAEGRVVRHLLNGKFLAKGTQEILWDGLTTPSDLKPGAPVPAGEYTWEAIRRKDLGLTMVGWANNAGKSPYDSPGGNWGGDFGPPSSVDADGERVYLGWGASEAGKAIVAVDFDGNVLWNHKRGGFGGASLVAADKNAVYVYDAGQGNALYRLNAAKGEFENFQDSDSAVIELGKILSDIKPASEEKGPGASGLAALDGKIFVSYGGNNTPWGKKQPSADTVVVLDGATGKQLQTIKVSNPGDLKVGADGKLYLVSNDSDVLVLDPAAMTFSPVVRGVKGISAITADKDGNLFIAVGDPENQVKVFSPAGKQLRTIGKAGGRPLIGPWEKEGMRFAGGLKIDGKGHLWVVERDSTPRRISVWNAQDGSFVKEFFGPTDYGATGGAINPADPLFMTGQGCEWKIDPQTGKAECLAVITRDGMYSSRFGANPADGRVYLAVGKGWSGKHPVNIFERLSPGVWKLRTTIEKGKSDDKWPDKVTVWADRNDDGKRQDDEIKEYDKDLGGWFDGWYLYFNQAMMLGGSGYKVAVTGWTPCGAPEYDLSKAEKLPVPEDMQGRGGMGAQRGLISEDGNFFIYNGHYGSEHSTLPVFDLRTGKQVFAYPNNYVGVHGGHLAPPPREGLVRAAYDIVGTFKMPEPLGNIFVIGTDKGEWHLLSENGYYVGKIFQGDPLKIQWPEEAIPGANMTSVPPGMGAEDFGGSVIHANDGSVYVQSGKTAFINSRLTGLDTVKTAGSGKLSIAPADLVKAQEFAAGYLAKGADVKSAKIASKTVSFSGDPGKDFGAEATIKYGSNGAAVESWLAHDDSHLYVAWVVEDKSPWVNGAVGFENLFGGGDTVDLQLETVEGLDAKRADAEKGDLRLSIGSLGGKNTAVIYRRVSDEKAPKVFYSGTRLKGFPMDLVKILPDVRIETKTLDGNRYAVEAAIPLKDLGLSKLAGRGLRGDVGVTFGDPAGKDTNLRLYWSNRNTGLVADEVEELRMQPAFWGELKAE